VVISGTFTKRLIGTAWAMGGDEGADAGGARNIVTGELCAQCADTAQVLTEYHEVGNMPVKDGELRVERA
jgi:hypothetical protein